MCIRDSFISFIVGFYSFKPKGYFDYKGFKVYKTKLPGINVNFYVIPVKSYSGKIIQTTLRNDPRSFENISVDVRNSLYGNITKVWLTSSPELPSDSIIAQGEIGRFSEALGLNTSYALTENISNYNTIDCSDANSNVRVIEIREGNKSRVYSEGYCIIIEGSNANEMIKVSDKFVLTWLERLALKAKEELS